MITVTAGGTPDDPSTRATAVRVAEAIRWTTALDASAGPAAGSLLFGRTRHDIPPPPDAVTVGGAPAGATCPEPDPNAEWVWIAPADDVTAASTGCTAGTMNGLPGCLYQAPDMREEIQFVQGVPVALVTHRGTSGTTASEIADSWRYVDDQRPEAQPGFMLEQPLFVDQDYAVAVSAGRRSPGSSSCWARRGCSARCDVAASFAGPGFDPNCTPADPPIDVTPGEASLTGAGGAVPVQKARVITDPGGRIFDLELQIAWSPTEQRGVWKVITSS